MHHDARVIGVWKKMWYDTYTIRRAEAISDRQEQERTMNQHKQFFQRLGAAAFWLAVWQCAAMAVGQEVFLVSPVQAVRTLLQLLPQAEFWQRVGFSSGRILLGFGLGVAVSIVLAVAAQAWHTADVLLAPVLQLVKATPVASFIILALVWVRGASLSVLISFLMVLPVLYGAVRTGIQSADPQLLEMTKVFRLPLSRRLRAVWLPAVLPAFRQGCSVALASAMHSTGPRSPFPPGSCSHGRL